MKFKEHIIEYLKGDNFSNALEISISQNENEIPNRLEIIEKLVKDKKIIHMGCCDHIPLIEDKIQSRSWLHARLCNSAKRCFGVDNNKSGIEYLSKELGYKDLICADIVNQEISEIKKDHWDYMVFGEIIEHLDNPVSFLKTIHDKYSKQIEKIIITVPNAFNFYNIKALKQHREIINSDHRYWFTPYTLAKVLTISKFNVDRFYHCQAGPLNFGWFGSIKPKNLLFKNKLKKYPAFRNTILVIANFNNGK